MASGPFENTGGITTRDREPLGDVDGRRLGKMKGTRIIIMETILWLLIGWWIAPILLQGTIGLFDDPPDEDTPSKSSSDYLI